jgi:hypothetical protein
MSQRNFFLASLVSELCCRICTGSVQQAKIDYPIDRGDEYQGFFHQGADGGADASERVSVFSNDTVRSLDCELACETDSSSNSCLSDAERRFTLQSSIAISV